MDKVLGTADIRMSYDELNKTRDYIADRTSTVTPVAKGGTGATTATGAKIALEVAADKIFRPGGDTIETTLNYLGSQDTAIGAAAAAANANAAAANANADGRVAKGGDTMSGSLVVNGHIYVPGASPAVSSYSVAYINGDGRLSRAPSALKYKKHVSSFGPAAAGSIFPDLKRFQMRSLDGTGDGDWKLGYIADELVGTDAERFVVRGSDGDVETIDFIQLLLVQVAQLNARVRELEGKQP
jgi:hypothetical protein